MQIPPMFSYHAARSQADCYVHWIMGRWVTAVRTWTTQYSRRIFCTLKLRVATDKSIWSFHNCTHEALNLYPSSHADTGVVLESQGQEDCWTSQQSIWLNHWAPDTAPILKNKIATDWGERYFTSAAGSSHTHRCKHTHVRVCACVHTPSLTSPAPPNPWAWRWAANPVRHHFPHFPISLWSAQGSVNLQSTSRTGDPAGQGQKISSFYCDRKATQMFTFQTLNLKK